MSGLCAAHGETLLKIMLIYVSVVPTTWLYAVELYNRTARMMDLDGHRSVWSWLVCSGRCLEVGFLLYVMQIYIRACSIL